MDDHECTSCEAMIAAVTNVFANPIMIFRQSCEGDIVDSFRGVDSDFLGLRLIDAITININAFSV